MTLVEDSGLICGFHLATLAPSGRALPERFVAEDPLWLHVSLADSRARDWVMRTPDVPEAARDLLLDSDPRVRIELLPGAIVAVLGDLFHDFDNDPERLGSLRLYLDSKLMLSARKHPLLAVDLLRRELTRGGEGLTPVTLFQTLLERLAGGLSGVAAQLSQQLEIAEDLILEGKFKGQSKPLGNLRRLVVRLRRLASANRAALATLPHVVPGLYDAAAGADLRSAVERLDAATQDLDLVQDRARLLQEEIASNMNEATNRNLFVLSIATTTLLPITLITGIFGMNVRGLPFAEHPHGFYWVMVGIAATVGFALWLLRRIGAL